MPDGPPLPSRRIDRVEVSTPWQALVPALFVAALGIALLLGVFEFYVGRLPDTLPSHYGANGQPDGWSSPASLLTYSIGLSALVSLLFIVMVALVGRSPSLSRHHGPTFWIMPTVVQAALVAVALPTALAIQYSSASGGAPAVGAVGEYLLLANLAPLVPVVVLLVAFGRRRQATTGANNGPREVGAGTPIIEPVEGGIEVRCSSCGRTFGGAHVSLLTPHLAMGGAGSLYLKCPTCGERAWDPVVRRG